MRKYPFKLTFAVLKEEKDGNGYDADISVVVPADYETANKAMYKSRALQYFSEWLKQNEYGSETYIIHLDDDSIVSEEYVRYVLGMNAECGQGSLRLRNYGYSLFSTLSDFGRIVTCDMYCSHSNSKNEPINVHGEGLVIRADVEENIGWDFVSKNMCNEDFLMGQSIFAKGYRFDYIPGGIFIAPPVTAKDFYHQRRRWIYGLFKSMPLAWKMNKKASAYLMFQNSLGWTVFVGCMIWLFSLLYRVSVPLLFIIIFTIGLAISFIEMQYGVYMARAKAKWHVAMFILQIPVTIFQSATFFYTLLFKPKSFDVIKKV
jgi:cellulose synthase/poly-beta-1,6-N-acetylglucosamine synthase-like glycosyltransferase